MTLLRPISLFVVSAVAIVFFTLGSYLSGNTDDAEMLSKAEQETSLNSGDLSPESIKKRIEDKLEGIEISSVELSPLDGFYQAFYSGQVLYVSMDGEFILTGNLLGLSAEQPVNLTEKAVYAKAKERSPQRAATIAALNEDDMVVFKSKKEQYTVTVFTDVDCAYCRKLHKEVPQLNELGITIRYLAFPRAGLGSSAHKKLESVWCSENKQLAMNNAKLKRQFSDKSCENPIAEQYKLTREFGLAGTPALILPDGELISGYLPYNKLSEYLKEKAEQDVSAGK
ncbi:MAG: thioredoxin fold domain-containing protein [Kangiellaceae bacterium]|nr:thioredoxin fold domain-containing protein [Kangiellaceae bacterium]